MSPFPLASRPPRGARPRAGVRTGRPLHLRCAGRAVAAALAAAFLVPAGAPAAAQEDGATGGAVPSRWTPELSMRFRDLGDVELSRDGSRAAYVVREPVMEGETSEYRTHIRVAATDGSRDVRYTRGEASATSPSFSPDGRYLAFLSARDDGEGSGEPETQVWAMRVSGGEAWRVTEAETGVSEFAWSPDGSRIAFTMTDPKSEAEREREREKRDVHLVDREFRHAHLYVFEFDPEAPPVTTPPAEEGEEDADEEGDEGGEAEAGAGEDAPEARRLTRGAFHVTGFDWSPDGRTIAFSHAPDPTVNTAGTDRDLSTVSVEGGEPSPLVTRPGVDGDPLFDPEGRRVAFVSQGGTVERVGLGDVWVVLASGGEPRKLPETPDRNANLLAWSADGSRVFVSEPVGTTVQVLAVSAEGDGTGERELGGGEREPAGGEPDPRGGDAAGGVARVTDVTGVVGSVAFDAAAERMAFTFQDTDTPEELYVVPVASPPVASPAPAPEARLSSVNVDVPAPPMGRTEVLGWTSPDGREIEGLLTYPVGYADGERVPLILSVHGGPAGVYTRSFTGGPSIYMLQTFAQEGYAILRPNPRGSTGYGKEFRYANVRDWGYGDYEDLMAGVDRVVEMGVAHPDSLAVMGWSYGGYMTSFVVTRTDRFRAASMGAGLPNLISMVTTTDIPDYLAAHMGGEFWEDYATYERHSAIYRIADVTTPTQVIHGAEDRRVPTAQGREFYVALKRRGVPTEMVLLPRTPHGPREPRLLMEVSKHILRWFETHVRGQGASDEAAAPAPAAGR